MAGAGFGQESIALEHISVRVWSPCHVGCPTDWVLYQYTLTTLPFNGTGNTVRTPYNNIPHNSIPHNNTLFVADILSETTKDYFVCTLYATFDVEPQKLPTSIQVRLFLGIADLFRPRAFPRRGRLLRCGKGSPFLRQTHRQLRVLII